MRHGKGDKGGAKTDAKEGAEEANDLGELAGAQEAADGVKAGYAHVKHWPAPFQKWFKERVDHKDNGGIEELIAKTVNAPTTKDTAGAPGSAAKL